MSNSKIPHLLQGKAQFIAGKNSVYRREKLSLSQGKTQFMIAESLAIRAFKDTLKAFKILKILKILFKTKKNNYCFILQIGISQCHETAQE